LISIIDKRILLDNTLEKLLYCQYIKIANQINGTQIGTILETSNQNFLNFFNLNQPKVLIIGKDCMKQDDINPNDYDIVFDFTANRYGVSENKLVLINSNYTGTVANLNIGRNFGTGGNIILLNNYTKRFLKTIFNLVDIKSCSQKVYFIVYILFLFKKVHMTGFFFNRELSKKQRYKELLLISFLIKYKYLT
jgi:hypothetical protein